MLYQENFKKTADHIMEVSKSVNEGLKIIDDAQEKGSDIDRLTLFISGMYSLTANIARSLAILADEAVAERKERETKADEVIKNLLEVDHERDKREKL